MRILITGGSGFIGKNIIEQLGNDNELFYPRRQELNLLDETAVSMFIKKNTITHIIHGAVPVHDFCFEETLRMNITMFHQSKHVEKVIYFGSGAEYGKTRDIKKISEEEFGEFIPEDSYGFAKYITYITSKKFPNVVNLRLFGIYGKYEDYTKKFISNSIVKKLLLLPVPIKQNVVFDYLYIDDLMPILRYFLSNNAKYTSYNVTPTKSISLYEIMTILNQVTNSSSQIIALTKGNNFEYTGNNKRILLEIPSLTFTSYRIGIIRLIEYYQKIIHTINRDVLIKDMYLQNAKVRG